MLFLAAAFVPASSQRIYNLSQDQKAEAALNLARQLASSAPFDKAVSNLGELQKLRNEDVFRSARLLVKAEMGSWRTWDDLEASILRFESALAPDLGTLADFQKELKEARAKEAEAREELAQLALRLSGNQPQDTLNLAGDWMERIAKVKPLADYLIGLEKDEAAKAPNLKAAGQAKAALDRLAQLYKSFRLSLPASPGSLFLESKLQHLGLEAQHIENQIGIRQRLDRELADIRGILGNSRNAMKVIKPLFPGKTIAESLDEQAAKARKTGGEETELLGTMLFLLYNCSALAARNHTPVRLAELRETLEERAHSLRQAGVSAAAYQAIITNGLQRLSLYYKGGIRPSTLSDLIQSLSTAGIVGAIAAK